MQRSWHEDFWRTVLHNDVRVIVMLEDGDNGSTVSFTWNDELRGSFLNAVMIEMSPL